MENKGFKKGNIVIFTPSKGVLEFIDKNPEYKKYIGEKAVVINASSSDYTVGVVTIQYLDPSINTTHNWWNKDLTLVPTEREFSGEV